MRNILRKDCLVLNKSWTPCNLMPIIKSIGKALKGRVKIIHPETLAPYSFYEWIDKGVEKDNKETFFFKGKRCDVPTIVCAIYYSDLHLKYTPLNHQNIYRRDKFTCVYCGEKKELTWDHIVPECKGGKTSWTNLVTCCKICNNRKDDMPVEEFCQIINCEIPRPVSLATTPWLLGKIHLRPEWKLFLKGGKSIL